MNILIVHIARVSLPWTVTQVILHYVYWILWVSDGECDISHDVLPEPKHLSPNLQGAFCVNSAL